MLFETTRRLARRPEPYVNGRFQEKWNTLSNLPFVIIGAFRWYQWRHQEDLELLYFFFIMAGVCSGIHHALKFRGSILFDWIPIVLSLRLVSYYEVWTTLSAATWFQLGMAFVILQVDHIVQLVPAPWGHVMWHITAAQSIDHAYMDYAHHHCLQ